MTDLTPKPGVLIFQVRFDGDCPAPRWVSAGGISSFRSEPAQIERRRATDGTEAYCAIVRHYQSGWWDRLSEALQAAATKAAGIQVNLVSIRSAGR